MFDTSETAGRHRLSQHVRSGTWRYGPGAEVGRAGWREGRRVMAFQRAGTSPRKKTEIHGGVTGAGQRRREDEGVRV